MQENEQKLCKRNAQALQIFFLISIIERQWRFTQDFQNNVLTTTRVLIIVMKKKTGRYKQLEKKNIQLTPYFGAILRQICECINIFLFIGHISHSIKKYSLYDFLHYNTLKFKMQMQAYITWVDVIYKDLEINGSPWFIDRCKRMLFIG